MSTPVDRTQRIASGEFLNANPRRVCVNRNPWPAPAQGRWEAWRGPGKYLEAHAEFTDAIAAADKIARHGARP